MTQLIGTPMSLAEVASVLMGAPQVPSWKPTCEFLDAFYEADCGERRRLMLAGEPAVAIAEEEAAFLAGLAEHLSIYYGLASPAWVRKPRYFLKAPYFPGPFRSKLVDAMCAVESPYAFRRRLVFVENEPLRRKLGPISYEQALSRLRGA